MSLAHRLLLRPAALLLPALLLTAHARAEDAIQTPAVQSQQPARPDAPVGHRQPRVSDVPSTTGAGDPSDRWLNRLNRETDRKLWICRNC